MENNLKALLNILNEYSYELYLSIYIIKHIMRIMSMPHAHTHTHTSTTTIQIVINKCKEFYVVFSLKTITSFKYNSVSPLE